MLKIPPAYVNWNVPPGQLPRNNPDVWIMRWRQIPNLYLCWYTRTRLQVLAHCYRTPNVEVGGVLVGGVYQAPSSGMTDTIYFIKITASIEAHSSDAGQGHVNFSPDSWNRVLHILDREYPDQKMVGWYHTHPGHGIFLSGHDLHIQNQFFSREFHVALVVETHEHRGGFFVGSQEQGGPFQSEIFEWDHDWFRQEWLGKRSLDNAPQSHSISDQQHSTVASSHFNQDNQATSGNELAISIEEEDLALEINVSPPERQRSAQPLEADRMAANRDESLYKTYITGGVITLLSFIVIGWGLEIIFRDGSGIWGAVFGLIVFLISAIVVLLILWVTQAFEAERSPVPPSQPSARSRANSISYWEDFNFSPKSLDKLIKFSSIAIIVFLVLALILWLGWSFIPQLGAINEVGPVFWGIIACSLLLIFPLVSLPVYHWFRYGSFRINLNNFFNKH